MTEIYVFIGERIAIVKDVSQFHYYLAPEKMKNCLYSCLIEGKEYYGDVFHLDGDKSNNALTNLAIGFYRKGEKRKALKFFYGKL